MNYNRIIGNRQIYTPRAHYTMIENNEELRRSKMRQTNTVMTIGDYQISIAMDSSHGDGDLTRTEVRVFKRADENDLHYKQDVTERFAQIVSQKMGYSEVVGYINDPVEVSIILNVIIEESMGK